MTKSRPLGVGRTRATIALEVCLLVAITALTRFAFRSQYLYDIDSVNFALAVRQFDPTLHQPQPPGYLLYVCLARLIHSFVPDVNEALVAISIAASCGAAIMLYGLSRTWFGTRAARCAVVLFIFSPLAWFHGTVALTYIVELFFSAAIGFLCWRGSVLAGAVMLGIAAGFRPSSLLFLGPLLVFSLWKKDWATRVAGVLVLLSTTFAWFIPLIRVSGGWNVWWLSLAVLWHAVPGSHTVLNSSIANSFARFVWIFVITGLCFGCTIFLPLVQRRSDCNRRLPAFILVWIAPGLLFFTFAFLKAVNSGYLLVLTPPVFAWLGLLASEYYKPGRRAVSWLVLASNVAIFLWAPVYCSYASVHAFERNLRSVLAALPEVASPADTLIVGFDSHFMGYRHAGYYLPGYLTLEFPAVRISDESRIFTMQDGRTRLLPELPPGYTNFIVFPLPRNGGEYQDYTAGFRNRFPPGVLRTQSTFGQGFITGPASALPTLFHVDH